MTLISPEGSRSIRNTSLSRQNAVPDRAASHAKGCEDCVKIGGTWVQLRECLLCRHAGCCDSSPHRHATTHFHATKHPVMRSVEPGEAWACCYTDGVMANLTG